MFSCFEEAFFRVRADCFTHGSVIRDFIRAAGAALGWPKKQTPARNVSDKPTSVWSGKARRVCGTDSIGNCNRRATPVARCTQSCCPKEHSHDGHEPGIAKLSDGISLRACDAANFIELRVSPEGLGLRQIRAVWSESFTHGS